MRGRVLGESAAVGAVFALNGAVIGNWVARIPDVAGQTHSSPAVLGLALLSVALGAVVAMPLVGRLCARVPARRVVVTAAASHCVTLSLVAFAHSPLVLGAVLVLFGASTGSTDVSMNVSAVTAIRHAGRPLMPLFHGGFSVGGMAGAAAGGLAAAHLGLGTHFFLATVVGLLLLAVIGPCLPPDRPVVVAEPRTGPGRTRGGRTRHLDATIVVLGVVVFCGAVGEGAMADWGALFLRRELGAGATLGAAGYTVFSIAMAASRFSGEVLINRFGQVATLVGSYGLAAVGALVVVGSPSAPVALLGFAAVGAGLAFAFPIGLNAAAAHPSGSGPAIGIVATVGYTGFLAGPPLIGFAAELAGLRVGLSLVVVVAVIGLVLAIVRRDLLQADPGSTDSGGSGRTDSGAAHLTAAAGAGPPPPAPPPPRPTH